MATIQDLERKHSRFITSQDEIVDIIASYGVDITKETPFQNYAGLFESAVSMKFAGVLNGTTPFNLDERDFKSVTDIRRYAFYQNASLVNVVIPEWITGTSNNVFNGCTKLKTVRLKGRCAIQAGTFGNCTALEKVYLPDVTSADEVPTLVNISAFTNTTCVFVVSSEEIKSFYITASNWNTLADRFVVEEVSV